MRYTPGPNAGIQQRRRSKSRSAHYSKCYFTFCHRQCQVQLCKIRVFLGEFFVTVDKDWKFWGWKNSAEYGKITINGRELPVKAWKRGHPMETKKKTAYFEWLRLFAAAAVVMLHTAGRVWSDVPCVTASWRALAFWDSLVRWPVALFVMITGAIFLPRKTEMKTVLTRYMPRMFWCYLLWAWLFARYEILQGAAPGTMWENIFKGQFHLWYLPFLCGVYLVIPFLQKIVEDDRLTGWLLAVSLVVGSLIPWLADLTSLVLPQYAHLVGYAKGHLNYTFFMDLLAALVLGHWLDRHRLPDLHRRVLYGCGLVSVAVTMAGTLYLSARMGKPVDVFFAHSGPLNICTAAAIFVFARENLTRLPRFVEGLANCSFGIYLSHALVQEFLYDRKIHGLMGNPVWAVPVLTAAVFAVCALGTALFRKIPVIGKYLT